MKHLVQWILEHRREMTEAVIYGRYADKTNYTIDDKSVVRFKKDRTVLVITHDSNRNNMLWLANQVIKNLHEEIDEVYILWQIEFGDDSDDFKSAAYEEDLLDMRSRMAVPYNRSGQAHNYVFIIIHPVWRER